MTDAFELINSTDANATHVPMGSPEGWDEVSQNLAKAMQDAYDCNQVLALAQVDFLRAQLFPATPLLAAHPKPEVSDDEIAERAYIAEELGSVREFIGESLLFYSLEWHDEACELDNDGDVVGFVTFAALLHLMLKLDPQSLVDLNLVDADGVERLKLHAEHALYGGFENMVLGDEDEDEE